MFVCMNSCMMYVCIAMAKIVDYITNACIYRCIFDNNAKSWCICRHFFPQLNFFFAKKNESRCGYNKYCAHSSTTATRPDCTHCINCLDKKVNGGFSIRKKGCLFKTCVRFYASDPQHM